MNKISDRLILFVLLPVIIGCGLILPVVYSANGYVAGFIFLPLLLLIGAASLILFIVGLIGLASANKLSAWLLLSAFLLPAGFIFSGTIAKYFEIGAYRQEPMISFNEVTNNVVIFKEGTTYDQINDFWEKTMSSERSDGRGYDHLPGIRDMGQNKTQNGQEAIVFGFFPNATEEQRQFIYARVKSSPIVHQLLKNQTIKEFNEKSATLSPISNSNNSVKKVEVINTSNSR